MRSQKAQLSLIIIIVILIICFLIVFFVARSFSPKKEKIDENIISVNDFVLACIRETGGNAILSVAKTSGFSSNFLYGEEEYNFYFDKGEINMPLKQKFVEEIGLYVDNMLSYCIKNFSELNDYNIKDDKIITDVKIYDDKVVFNLNYPLTIKRNEKTYTINNFEGISVNTRLGLIYSIVNNFTNEQKINPKDVCFSCLTKIANDNDLFIDIQDTDEDIVLFVITDKSQELNRENLTKFSGEPFENSHDSSNLANYSKSSKENLQFIFANRYGK